ncbi:hypothetical protein ACSQ67_021317 [Phaseolus vulgaris]
MDSKRREQTPWIDNKVTNHYFPHIRSDTSSIGKSFIPTLNRKRKRSVDIDVVIEKFVESIKGYEKMYENTRDDNLKQKKEKMEKMMVVFKEMKKMKDLTEIQKVCAATMITDDYYTMVYYFTIQAPERKASFVHELLTPHLYSSPYTRF